MTLILRDTNEAMILVMGDDNKTLHDYGCKDDYTIHFEYTGQNTVG